MKKSVSSCPGADVCGAEVLVRRRRPDEVKAPIVWASTGSTRYPFDALLAADGLFNSQTMQETVARIRHRRADAANFLWREAALAALGPLPMGVRLDQDHEKHRCGTAAVRSAATGVGCDRGRVQGGKPILQTYPAHHGAAPLMIT